MQTGRSGLMPSHFLYFHQNILRCFVIKSWFEHTCGLHSGENNKQLLSNAFAISGIVKVEVSDNRNRDLDYVGYRE